MPGASNWHWSVKSGQERGILIPEAFLTANVTERNESPANLKPELQLQLVTRAVLWFSRALRKAGHANPLFIWVIVCRSSAVGDARRKAARAVARVSAEIQLPLCNCCDESEAGDCMHLLANEQPIKHGLRIVIGATKDRDAVPSYA